MKFEEHCKESIRLFNKSFDEVHHWLDEFATSQDSSGKKHFNPYHRKHRHHLAGANEVLNKWGRTAYEAAIQHIRSDLENGGGLSKGEELPKDEKDYVAKGFF